MPNQTRTANNVPQELSAGPFKAKVMKHLDGGRMGTLMVSLMKETESGDVQGEDSQLITARYLSPFYGTTGKQVLKNNKDFNSTQQAYGFWMVPPDVGTIVLIIFVEGTTKECFWIGCVQDEFINMQVPGVAPATDVRWKDDEPGDITGKRLPTGEINTALEENKANSNPTSIKRPYHPHQAAFLQEQGLLDDWVRGTTSSSARRDIPSMVFGISSPGPLDFKGPKAKYGTRNDNVMRPHVRMGGTSIVMDDGDETLHRKKPASEGPIEYSKDEKTNIPYNELFRIRTRTGHQILLHNSEDLIYIGNARGTSWIEMTSNGKIDIYAQDSVSIHTENDFNFKAGRDINLEAGNDINLVAANNIQGQASANVSLKAEADGLITVQGTLNTYSYGDTMLTTGANMNLHSDADSMFTATGKTNINSAGHYETAGEIHMNGPTAASAATAAQASSANKPVRVPLHEPWFGHEHLDPEAVKPDATVAIPGDGEPNENIEGNTRASEIENLDETRFPEEPPEFPTIDDPFKAS